MTAAALVFEPLAEGEGRLEIPAGGVHTLPGIGAALKAALLAAVVELRPRRDARVEVLGEDVARLTPRARAALGAQVAYLPADGGLISHLNGWENIALPHAYHAPRSLPGLAERARGLLEQAGAEPQALFARLPEEMTPQQRRLAAYVRMRLGRPRLVLAEELGEALAAAYLEECPQGTLVLLQDAPDESG